MACEWFDRDLMTWADNWRPTSGGRAHRHMGYTCKPYSFIMMKNLLQNLPVCASMNNIFLFTCFTYSFVLLYVIAEFKKHSLFSRVLHFRFSLSFFFFSFFSFLRFLDHTQRRIRVGRTPLDEWSVRRRDLYLTTHHNHNRQTSMPPVGFEPTISAGFTLIN